MAPTEILAEQHFIAIRDMLEDSRVAMEGVDGLVHDYPEATHRVRARIRRH